jgi:hypothetical protein
MTDTRYLSVALIIAIFMVVTVGHVARYAGGFEAAGWQFLGWPYALAVDASIVVCAWLTRWASTRRWAWRGYVLFVLASGAMNAAAIEPWAQALAVEAAFAWVYALFPTAAIGVLGFLARQADEGFSASAHKRGAIAAIGTNIGAKLHATRHEAAQVAEPVAPASANLPAPAQLPRATIEDWRVIYASMNGDRANLTPDLVTEALAAANLAPPSARTVYHWIREAKDGAGE